MNLAIKGHVTRGKEVIEILKMLGGKNIHNAWGVFTSRIYTIDEKTGEIIDASKNRYSDYNVFSLEEFLEKFPYKVGDKVRTIYGKIGIISKPIWSTRDGCIRYELEADTDSFYFVNELQPHNEKTMDRKYNVEEYLQVWEETEKGLEVVVNDKFELKEDSGKFYIIKKQPQYPKTYEECCDILRIETNRIIEYDDCLGYRDITQYDINLLTQLKCFRKLRIYRDAYWKIAGVEMGLDKPWEPDLENEELYCIQNYNKQITISRTNTAFNKILIFPNKEMRDAFYENFKELIENCKEFL